MHSKIEVGHLEPDLVTAVEAQIVGDKGLVAFFLCNQGHGVGKLDFSALARFDAGQVAHVRRAEDVAADDTEIAGGFFRFRFLDKAADGDAVTIAAADGVNNAVVSGAFGRHLFGHHDALAGFFVHADHLGETIAVVTAHDVIWQQHGEGIISGNSVTAPDGVAETERLTLAGVVHTGVFGQNIAD